MSFFAGWPHEALASRAHISQTPNYMEGHSSLRATHSLWFRAKTWCAPLDIRWGSSSEYWRSNLFNWLKFENNFTNLNLIYSQSCTKENHQSREESRRQEGCQESHQEGCQEDHPKSQESHQEGRQEGRQEVNVLRNDNIYLLNTFCDVNLKNKKNKSTF